MCGAKETWPRSMPATRNIDPTGIDAFQPAEVAAAHRGGRHPARPPFLPCRLPCSRSWRESSSPLGPRPSPPSSPEPTLGLWPRPAFWAGSSSRLGSSWSSSQGPNSLPATPSSSSPGWTGQVSSARPAAQLGLCLPRQSRRCDCSVVVLMWHSRVARRARGRSWPATIAEAKVCDWAAGGVDPRHPLQHDGLPCRLAHLCGPQRRPTRSWPCCLPDRGLSCSSAMSTRLPTCI